jgi:hypothetical protein
MRRRVRFELAVNLHRDAVAKLVHHQDLLRFRKSQLHGAAVLDRRERRGAGPAVVTRDHTTSACACHAGRHRPDAGQRHSLT